MMFSFLHAKPTQHYTANLAFLKVSASHITPLMVCKQFNAPVLLESAFLQTGKGRFSLLVLANAFSIIKQNGHYLLLTQAGQYDLQSLLNTNQIPSQTLNKDSQYLDFLDAFRHFAPNLESLSPKLKQELNSLPLPFGGVGYLGFEFFEEIEEIELTKPKLVDCYDNAFLFGRDFVIFDHFYQLVYILSISYDYETQDFDLQARVQQIKKTLEQPFLETKKEHSSHSTIISEDKKAFYMGAVEILKQKIKDGDLLQCVPSQSMQIKSNLSPLEAYENLRISNPSPYLYYYNFQSFQIIGSSPEALIRVVSEGGQTHLFVRPIAGTRPRGKTPAQDATLQEELQTNQKENAEHLMLLDLGRNDIGKVALPGSVCVTQEKIIEKYANVMHLVSEVKATLNPRYKKTDALLSVFPAGTVSGAPKIEAIKNIQLLEKHARGIYSGAIGYFCQNQDMDFAIAIRSAIYQNGLYYLQAGAGVVYDSDPLAEYIETQNKMLALVWAIMGKSNQNERMDREQEDKEGPIKKESNAKAKK